MFSPLWVTFAIVFYGLEYEEEHLGIIRTVEETLLPYEWAFWFFVVVGGGGLIYLTIYIFYILGGKTGPKGLGGYLRFGGPGNEGWQTG